jgi:N-carbamoylputrescine amidase
MPSRLTAEAPDREERARLLAEVTAKGFIDHYSGVRVSSSGRRFRIEGAVVWNLIDQQGHLSGTGRDLRIVAFCVRSAIPAARSVHTLNPHLSEVGVMSGSPFTIALVQETDQGSAAANLDACERESARPSRAVRVSFCFRSCTTAPTSARPRTPPASISPSRSRVRAPSDSARWPSELGVVIVASLFERRAPGLYHNTAVVLDSDGRLAGVYRKMHIPDDPGYYEKFYFTPGDLGFEPIDTSVGRLGVLVCWDQWYPEAARLMALAGAEILLYPTAIGWDPNDAPEEQTRQREAWVGSSAVMRSRTHSPSRPAIGSDSSRIRAARRPAHFWGHSFVCGPQGEILAQAGDETPQILFARSTRPARSRSADSGPSCATAASMPTATSTPLSGTSTLASQSMRARTHTGKVPCPS